jgi:CRISPR/Cas system CMR subunit Cmr6 (Cas7 group RAMP superfamily)
MSHDYFVALTQRRYDLENIDSVSLHYHRRIALDCKDDADELRGDWQQERLKYPAVPVPDLWSEIAIPTLNLAQFPPYTFALQFPFRLTKAYLSKDDRAFYIVDNPVRRDKVFRLPYVAPSSWKGSLRAALWNRGHDEDESAIRRLFGNERVPEEDFQAGRLRFFPTYFKQHGLEIINPHDRTRRVGTKPILFESVPPDTSGVFSLLYVPFSRIGQDDLETHRQLAEDLALVAEGVRAMFCTYGFGAKTNSGYGTAEDGFVDKTDLRSENLPEGQVQLKAILDKPEEVSAFEQAYWPIDKFPPEEWQTLLEGDEEATKAYHAARKAHERHQKNIKIQRVSQTVGGFGELVDVLRGWAADLEEEVPGE